MKYTAETYRRLVAAKLYMDRHFHETIDLAIISRQAFMSRFHFHRIFRKVYKRTPHQYLTRKRLDKARDLLAGSQPVTSICNEVGFESPGSFSVLFKKEIGYAPQYYRNLACKKKLAREAEPRKAIPHCFLTQYSLDK